jgi:N,N'-diacetyllegionaminate synthase
MNSAKNGSVTILGRQIGPGWPCLIIAEAGVNHNGDMDLAYRLIDAAAAAGADAIKFQAFVTEELVTPDAPKANYQVETTGQGGGQFEMLKKLELTAEQQLRLKERSDAAGLIHLCTPYDELSADMLDELDIPAYKIASTDTTNLPFLKYLAAKNRPVLLSTGMSNMAEVDDAMAALDLLKEKTIILHCTSQYPAPEAESNLRAMATMAEAYDCPVGYSDHSAGIGVSPWAVAAGACVIEKHFTLDRTLSGPDHAASIEPQELGDLVNIIADIDTALGDGVKRATESEMSNKPSMQKSVVTRSAIKAGTIIKSDDLALRRPATGLSPKWLEKIIGHKVVKDLPENCILSEADIDWSESC